MNRIKVKVEESEGRKIKKVKVKVNNSDGREL
jgi:hypothetical protein